MAVLCLVVSTKEIVMNENEFEIDGVSYVATKDSTNDCNGCAFSMDDVKCVLAPACGIKRREDGRSVIFVEKQQ